MKSEAVWFSISNWVIDEKKLESGGYQPGPVTFTTALVETPLPLGDVQLTITVLLGPLVVGAEFESVQATEPSVEPTVIMYAPGEGSAIGFVSPTCLMMPRE